MNALKKRAVDISYRHRLTHLSSVLNTIDTLDHIYTERNPLDPVVLGNSHASLALFVVLEKNGLCDAEEMVRLHGTHACRDVEHGIWVSGGSLGQAETVAVGYALSNPHRTVWLVTSDGACMEGSVAEAFRIAHIRCPNLEIRVIYNGFGAYGPIELADVCRVVREFDLVRCDGSDLPSWLRGLPGHYLTLNAEQYQELMR